MWPYTQAVYVLPFDAVPHFGPFFSKLEGSLGDFGVANFGVSITTLEDVFLKVGYKDGVAVVAVVVCRGNTRKKECTHRR